METATPYPESWRAEIAAGQRRMRRQEALLGLLFVAPATLAMLIFGLFPVVYGFFVSMQAGTIIPQGFVGLDNYVKAVGSLAYLLALAAVLFFVLMGYRMFRTPFAAMQKGKGDFYRYLIPAFLAAAATLILLLMLFTDSLSLALSPLIVLIIAGLIYYYFYRQHPTDFTYIVNSWGAVALILLAVVLTLFTFTEMYLALNPLYNAVRGAVSTLSASYNANKYVVPLDLQLMALLGITAGSAALYFIRRAIRQQDTESESSAPMLLPILRWVVMAIIALLLLYVISALDMLRGTLGILGRVTPENWATFTALKPADLIQQVLAWPQVFTLLLGIVLIVLAYIFWMNATRHATSLGMLRMFGIGIVLMVGGWLLIGELPNAAGSGDSEFYQSLLRTATYAVLTVPVQLSLGIMLAYLLFHEITLGKSIFRIVYFMPYIAPTVATAAVFVVMFSSTSDGLVNQILMSLGIPYQGWLRDPSGVFEIIAKLIGGRNTRLPSFLVGPSLPLLTTIIYSIWVFSGYNAVIFLAGLGAVPRELYEAAQVDGAGRWANFRHITIPLISPTTFFLTILAIIGTFKAFNHIYVLRSLQARGAMDTTTVYIFNMIREGSKPIAYASTTAFILFGIILILTLIQTRASRDQVFYG